LLLLFLVAFLFFFKSLNSIIILNNYLKMELINIVNFLVIKMVVVVVVKKTQKKLTSELESFFSYQLVIKLLWR